MYELLKKSLKKFEAEGKQVWFVTLTVSPFTEDRDIQRDFVSLWMKMKFKCRGAECFYAVINADDSVNPPVRSHVHLLVVDFFYPKETLFAWWQKIRCSSSWVRKSLVDFERIENLAVYFSTQHGVVYDVGCSDEWCQDE